MERILLVSIMANVWAVHSVGDSLVVYLRNTYDVFLQQNEPSPDDTGAANPVPDCSFRLLSSIEIDDIEDDNDINVLSLYLYRVNINEHLRNLRQGSDFPRRDVPLSLDLHYLMTVWSKNAVAEQLILAWAMRQLHANPILDQSYLSTQANWDGEEVVQIIPAELSHEDMMRIWDTLKPSYRLSFGYVARVVRIESEQLGSSRPTVANRMMWGEPAEVVR